MMSDDVVTRKAFMDFAGNAARSIAMINANLKLERVVEVVG
jgi:ATP-binding protein involved in chromosome partitioning